MRWTTTVVDGQEERGEEKATCVLPWTVSVTHRSLSQVEPMSSIAAVAKDILVEELNDDDDDTAKSRQRQAGRAGHASWLHERRTRKKSWRNPG